MDSELSRPVIEIREFPTRRLTHEMFAFGSEIAVVPVSEDATAASPVRQLAAVELARLASGFTGAHVHAAIFTSDNAADIYVDDKSVGGVVGSGGSSIRALEEEVGGVRLKVKGASEMPHGMRRHLEESSWQSDLSDMRSRGGKKWEDGGGQGHREAGGGRYSGKQGGRGGGRRRKGGRR
jgi:ATPase